LLLENLRVIEFATMVAAPAAAGLLADWGADVIKIEPHTGDPMRGTGGALGSTNFDLHNRGKRSISLNTKSEETRDIIMRLVRDADLFVTNVLPGQLEKLGLDYPKLAAVNPRLVYGEVSSFSREGTERDRPATDNLGFWARGGATALLTPKGSDPLPIRQSVGDRITGLSACVGMLAALFEASITGKGRLVDASLLRSAVWTFGTDVTNQLVRGRVGSTKGRHDAVLPLSNYFKTRDGRWLQLHTSIGQLAPALGQPELARDPRWSNPRAARENGAALVDAVDGMIGKLDFTEARALLEAGDIRWEPVQTPGELVADPQAIAAGCFVAVPKADAPSETETQVAGPVTFYEGVDPLKRGLGKPPRIGEHTREVLLEIGYGEADLERLIRNGTIPPQAGAA
jgi:crotonobetainyl-CoA:carnitine CoA-transferase CaiB-like acyl-CoA transferase